MAQVNIRMDDGLKEKAEVFLNELGFTFSSAFNVFIRQAMRERRIPFDIKHDLVIEKKTRSRSSKSIEERFEEHYGTDFKTALSENPYNFDLVDWGMPVGEEVW